MANYTCTFKSLRAGTVYTVTIGGGSGATVALKGAAQPFVTEEDGNEDFFTPIRTQTGYLRVVDDGSFDWRDLTPATDTERPVTVTNDSGTVVWQGYLQAQSFSGELYGNPQEREFPVHCPLSALAGGTMLVNASRTIETFARIISDVFGTLSGVTINRYIFQGGVNARQWLLKRIDWQNLVTEEDESGATEMRYDPLQMLTDVCQYWGWSCRMSGQDVIFTRMDDSATNGYALVLTGAQLSQLAGGVSVGTIDAFLLSEITMPTTFASTDNDQTMVRGVSRAVVKSDVGDTAASFKFADKSAEKEMENAGSWAWDGYNGNTKIGYFHTPMVQSLGSIVSKLRAQSVNGGGFFRQQMYTSDEQESAQTEDAIILVDVDGAFNRVTLQWQRLRSYMGGSLKLSGKVYTSDTDAAPLDANKRDKWRIHTKLGIGETRATARWFYIDVVNGRITTGWSSTEREFFINIADGRVDGISADLSGYGLTYIFASAIPLPNSGTPLVGNMYIEMTGQVDESRPTEHPVTVIHLADFEVAYDRNDVEITANSDHSRTVTEERDDTREYKSTNGNRCSDEWDANNIWATDSEGTMQYGTGLVMDENYAFMQEADYGGVSAVPEQQLADRVTRFWQHSRELLTVELQAQAVSNVTPRMTVGGYYPIAISRDWRDDILILSMIQL